MPAVRAEDGGFEDEGHGWKSFNGFIVRPHMGFRIVLQIVPIRQTGPTAL